MIYRILGIIYFLFASKFRFTDGCAPYFETDSWKQKAQQMNSSAYCDQQFTNPDRPCPLHRQGVGLDHPLKPTLENKTDGNPGVIVVGERYCHQIFVGRAYANYVCMQNLNDLDSLKGIDCGKMSHTSDGKLPWQVSFTITCSYARAPSYSKTCLWSEAEAAFVAHCSPSNGKRFADIGSGGKLGGGGTGYGIGNNGKVELGAKVKVKRVKVKVLRDGRRVAKFKRSRVINENTVIENTNIIIIDANGRPKRIKMVNRTSITDFYNDTRINATRMPAFAVNFKDSLFNNGVLSKA
uniref:Uncharacterized protein n=1 Tax=Romanomermis culicivorax TaxID=13658 RepID=A0A915JAK8_ROMCU